MTLASGGPPDRARVLVTGGGGFVGRHCLSDLVRRGYEVHATTSRPRPHEGPIAWHVCDLLRPGAPGAVVDEARPTHLVHLAWETTHGAFWSSPANLRWLGASLELAAAFVRAGGRRAVVAGTCAEYRWGGEGPLRETATPLEPGTLYGASKHALHVALAAFAAQEGIELAWGRIFFLYGPGEPPGRLVPSVARAMLEGREAACSHGRQIRDFLYVEDAGRAFGALLASDVTGPVNIASGLPVSIADVAGAIGEATGRPDLLRLGALSAAQGDPPALVGDASRLRDEVGWRPSHDLAEGLRLTVERLGAAVAT